MRSPLPWGVVRRDGGVTPCGGYRRLLAFIRGWRMALPSGGRFVTRPYGGERCRVPFNRPCGFRYRGTGRRVVGPYGGVVAVCHSTGQVVFVTGRRAAESSAPTVGSLPCAIQPAKWFSLPGCGPPSRRPLRWDRCRVPFNRPSGFRYRGTGRRVVGPYGGERCRLPCSRAGCLSPPHPPQCAHWGNFPPKRRRSIWKENGTVFRWFCGKRCCFIIYRGPGAGGARFRSRPGSCRTPRPRRLRRRRSRGSGR